MSSNVLRVHRSRKAKNLFFAQNYLKDTIKKNDEMLFIVLQKRGHSGRKLEAYMPPTIQTCLGVLQTTPFPNESTASL